MELMWMNMDSKWVYCLLWYKRMIPIIRYGIQTNLIITRECLQSIDGSTGDKSTLIDEERNNWNHICTKYYQSQSRDDYIDNTLTEIFLKSFPRIRLITSFYMEICNWHKLTLLRYLFSSYAQNILYFYLQTINRK